MPINSSFFNRFVSKFMVYRALSDKTHLFLGLRSPLKATRGYIWQENAKADFVIQFVCSGLSYGDSLAKQ